MLQAVQLPAGVADLHARLAHVNAQALPHLALLDQGIFGDLSDELEHETVSRADRTLAAPVKMD